MQKHISAAELQAPPVRVVIITLDSHLEGAVVKARRDLQRDIPGINLKMHVTAEWGNNPKKLQSCKDDIANGDIIIATMLFMDDQIQAILPSLLERRNNCDAMVGCISGPEIVKLTKLGKLSMDGTQKGPMAFLKKLRGKPKEGGGHSSSGEKQMAMLRRLPKILRFIPGTAQDLRAYFLMMQYWLSGSDANVANMVRFLVGRYAAGSRAKLRGSLKAADPVEYPEIGVYHPRMKDRISSDASRLPRPAPDTRGTIGLLVMRSYVLGSDTGHYDGVISALEAQGLEVLPVFSHGLDARPAIEKFFKDGSNVKIDALVSLTGFSLVGGPAYNDAHAAEEILADLDIPYIAAQPIEFQTIEQWRKSDHGLMPIESTIMVAIPELDGSTVPTVFGGRSGLSGKKCDGCDRGCEFELGHGEREMRVCAERAEQLASRVSKIVSLRRAARAKRKIAITLFNFPPNAGATGSAAFLSVFESLHNTMSAMRDAGYSVTVPDTVDTLRNQLLEGNSSVYGTDANVHLRIAADDHVRTEPHLAQIEKQWGPAPGRQLSDGRSIFVLGAQFGNVFVGIQPGFGYEGDPMRLLFEKGFAPTHAFSAYYRYLRDGFGADAVIHFGTHGALEFMPGKQVGLSSECWPERLIGNLPNYYFYASNNPSEGMMAKRRSAATLISYLTPPVAQAGLYKGLAHLKTSLERWRSSTPENTGERSALAQLIHSQAVAVDLAQDEDDWSLTAEEKIDTLSGRILEVEYSLIPHGMHVIGKPHSEAERIDLLRSIAKSGHGTDLGDAAVAALASGKSALASLRASGMDDTPEHLALFEDLHRVNKLLSEEHEISGLIHALDGKFTRPAPGGDLMRTTDVLPTGRNVHGFDPFRIPSAFAVGDGARQADRLLARHMEDGNGLPETVAIVLWGTDTLKTEGGPVAQAMSLMGTRPRQDSYGRVCGAELIPLEELGRPRIDVMMTLSGIFRDLLPLQTKVLAEAAWLAAVADEPEDRNFIRKHALAHMAEHNCDIETAALRVFSNADGAYGANVNHLIDSGAWNEEDELAEAYSRRKCFAYGRGGQPEQHGALLQSILKSVDVAYQNLESVELGITSIDHYFDTLGGIGRAVKRARGEDASVYIGDQTMGEGKVRTLSEQVDLEARTRMLNPKWIEGLLKHGYEGVREIEAHVTNTVGWSATTGQVQPWVYSKLTETFVLDPEMRQRMAQLNPKASAKLANRMIEASDRNYWKPDQATLDALRQAGEELEDNMEGIFAEAVA